MKKIFIALTVFSTFFSCKKEINTPLETESGIKSRAKSLEAGDGSWDLLGFGYDVTGEYANSSASTYSIIDINKLKLEHPTYVSNSGAETGKHIYESGQDAEELSDKLTLKLNIEGGVGKLFKGTYDFNGSYEDKFNAKYIYSTYSIIAIKRTVKLIADINLLKGYLHSGFLNHVQSLTPQELVNIYGTHILTNIKLGGKLELIYRAETRNSSRSLAASAGSKNSFAKVFSLATEGTYNHSDVELNFNEKAFVKTVGGNAGTGIISTITFNSSGTPNLTFNPTAWSAGLTDANAELIDIAPGGLLPIYELIDDPTKKSAIKNYIIQYMTERQVNVYHEIQPVYQYFGEAGFDHVYTHNAFIPGGYWNNEGVAFYAYTSQNPGTVPVYQYFGEGGLDHLYSTGNGGDNYWKNEGVAFYAFNYQAPGTVPVYQYFGEAGFDHIYTTNSSIGGNYWRNEGIAFYARTSY